MRPFEKEYLETDFVVVDGPRLLTIRVGEQNPDLGLLLADRVADEWAFVTAHNPRSVTLTPAENDIRQTGLCRLLDDEGYRYLNGYGQGTDLTWPAETSVLILNITPAQAIAIAKHFDQNAIVTGSIDTPAKLVWCDD